MFFFPEKGIEKECNKWGVELLPLFIKENSYWKVIIVSADTEVLCAIDKLDIKEMKCVGVSGRRMENMMYYYALVDMSGLWTVVSVTIPYDTGAERVVGRKKITYKDIVYYDIYRLPVVREDGNLAGEEAW